MYTKKEIDPITNSVRIVRANLNDDTITIGVTVRKDTTTIGRCDYVDISVSELKEIMKSLVYFHP